MDKLFEYGADPNIVVLVLIVAASLVVFLPGDFLQPAWHGSTLGTPCTHRNSSSRHPRMTDVNDSKPAAAFEDTSAECGICLSSYTEDAGKRVIQLGCGHKWHLDCVKEQLQHAQPNYAQRLVFQGCRCAKCGAVCEHAELEHLTRPTDRLRAKVDRILAEQMQISHPDTAASLGLMGEGRRTYAFYLCSSCEEPYFGGTVDCADQVEGERPGQDRLCPSCTPQTVCQHPVEHRGAYVWKCRYCCQPATHVCYGTVHFCDACHSRNSERVAQQLRQRQRSHKPPPLEAIPCPDNCPFPKPTNATRHANGAEACCEKMYACSMCESAPSRFAFLMAPGSRNLLVNPCGQEGLSGWQQLNRQQYWQVETCDVPVSEGITTNFVSGFAWCIMAQRVLLHNFVRDPSAVRIEVTAKFMGRTDCPSVFRLEAVLLDAGGRRSLQAAVTPALSAPSDSWERASLVLEASPGAHALVVVVHGKDERFWRGSFGSKVTDISVRILGENLDEIMLE